MFKFFGFGSRRDEADIAAGSVPASLTALVEEVRKFGHPEHPLLHVRYSPMSRMPAGDFSPFIIAALERKDTGTVGKLMKALVAANPGIGTDGGWIADDVRNVAALPFHRYVDARRSRNSVELATLFIMAGKDGGGREFWLTKPRGFLFACALCCNGMAFRDSTQELFEKANTFIRRMRRDIPFWRTYELFERGSWKVAPPEPDPLDDAFAALPLGARMQLLHYADPERDWRVSLHDTTSEMRTLGANGEQSAPLLLASPFCQRVNDARALADCLARDDIIGVLTKGAMPFKKSWKKERLLEALMTEAPGEAERLCDAHAAAIIREATRAFLTSRLTYARQLAEPLSLLFFIA